MKVDTENSAPLKKSDIMGNYTVIANEKVTKKNNKTITTEIEEL